MNDESADETKVSPVPLSASARRVLGVLVEKAKTTPDNYPLTLSGIVTGSNQKSNRDPKMDLDDEDGPEDAESEVSEVEEPTRVQPGRRCGRRSTPPCEISGRSRKCGMQWRGTKLTLAQWQETW